MNEQDKRKEIESLKQLTKRFLTELNAGDYFEARSTALSMHYGAQILWHDRPLEAGRK